MRAVVGVVVDTLPRAMGAGNDGESKSRAKYDIKNEINDEIKASQVKSI